MELNPTTVSSLAAKLATTPEVLTQFLSQDAPEAEVQPFAETLGSLKIFQPAQFEERLTNERNSVTKDAERIAAGNTYGKIEKDIFKETGIEKGEKESTVEYMLRAAKEKFGKPADESELMQQLRQAVADKDALLIQKNGELEQLKVTHATEAKTLQINARLDNAINGLAIDATADLLDSQREFLKFKFNQKYEADLVDGKVVFKDKASGTIVKDTTTASPLTEAALIAQFAPTVVSIKQSQRSGAGVKAADKSNNSGTDNPADFATLDEYKKHLTENGVTLLSTEGQAKISAYMKAQNK